MKDCRFPMVFVIWEDICRRGGWHTPEETRGLMQHDYLIGSLGFLVQKTKKKVVLSQGQCYENGDLQDCLVIPSSNIKKIYPVKVQNGKTRPKTKTKG